MAFAGKMLAMKIAPVINIIFCPNTLYLWFDSVKPRARFGKLN